MLSDIVFTIDHNRPTFSNITTSHSHGSMEITLCMSNGGTFCVDDQIIPVSRGLLLVMQSGVNHYCIADLSTFDRYCFRFHSHTLDSISSLQTDLNSLLSHKDLSVLLTEEQTLSIASLADKCRSCGIGFGEDVERVAYFLQLLIEIATIMRSSSRSPIQLSNKNYNKVLPAIQYIHENYTENISIEKLSALCYLSKYYLSHMFKEATGFSVKDYIANYRIRKACELFHSGMSIQSIGSAVGYSNSSYFIQTFKKIVGTTPGHFQNFQ